MDKTRLSCLVRVSGVNTIGQDKTVLSCLNPVSNFSVVLSIFETEQLKIGNWVETRQNSHLVANCVHTADTDKTRQFDNSEELQSSTLTRFSTCFKHLMSSVACN